MYDTRRVASRLARLVRAALRLHEERSRWSLRAKVFFFRSVFRRLSVAARLPAAFICVFLHDTLLAPMHIVATAAKTILRRV